jgi:hypothetical protein
MCLRDVLLFRVAVGPDFVALDALGIEKADVRIVEANARGADLFDETENRHLRGAGHAEVEAIELPSMSDMRMRGAFLRRQLVHAQQYMREGLRSHWVRPLTAYLLLKYT